MEVALMQAQKAVWINCMRLWVFINTHCKDDVCYMVKTCSEISAVYLVAYITPWRFTKTFRLIMKVHSRKKKNKNTKKTKQQKPKLHAHYRPPVGNANNVWHGKQTWSLECLLQWVGQQAENGGPGTGNNMFWLWLMEKLLTWTDSAQREVANWGIYHKKLWSRTLKQTLG